MGCHLPIQGIFPTRGLNPGLLHWQADSLPLSHQGSLVRNSASKHHTGSEALVFAGIAWGVVRSARPHLRPGFLLTRPAGGVYGPTE